MKPLFRAWDGNRRLDILSIDFVNNEMETISYDIQEGEDAENRPIENLEQYTGVEDKNGVKIFEGDIWEYGAYIGQIAFEYCGWTFKTVSSSKCISYPYFYSCASKGTIIGNIYENPELLIKGVRK